MSVAVEIKTYPARQAKNQFGAIIEEAQRSPVRITRNGRPVGGFVDERRFQKLLDIEREQKRRELRDAFRELCAEVDSKPKLTLKEAMELMQTDEEEVLTLLGEDYFTKTA